MLETEKFQDILDRYNIDPKPFKSGGEGRIFLGDRKDDPQHQKIVLKIFKDGVGSIDDLGKAQEGAGREAAFLYSARENAAIRSRNAELNLNLSREPSNSYDLLGVRLAKIIY